MILPDVNVLIHAHNLESPFHEPARVWWDECLAGSENIALPWVAILGFVRITTHRKILANPLPVDEVMARVESWLALPHVSILHPSDQHFSGLREDFRRLGTAGNLTTDAHLAVLARQKNCTLFTTDKDFQRFPDLDWVNPCAESSQ